MSNKLKPKKKHKEPDFTWTKSERVTLKNSDSRRKLVRRSFTDFMDLGYWINTVNAEVIGNIIDNPELLESEG